MNNLRILFCFCLLDSCETLGYLSVCLARRRSAKFSAICIFRFPESGEGRQKDASWRKQARRRLCNPLLARLRPTLFWSPGCWFCAVILALLIEFTNILLTSFFFSPIEDVPVLDIPGTCETSKLRASRRSDAEQALELFSG